MELQRPQLDLVEDRLKAALVPQQLFLALPKSQHKQRQAQQRQVEVALWLELQDSLQNRGKDRILANLRGHMEVVARLRPTKGHQVLPVSGLDQLKVPAKSMEPRSFSAGRLTDCLQVCSRRHPPTHRQLPRTVLGQRSSHWLLVQDSGLPTPQQTAQST